MSDEPNGDEAAPQAPPEVPLDQSTAPIDQMLEGLNDDTPLDQTRSEIRQVLGSEQPDADRQAPRPRRR
jgi:hypothetical protein